MLSCFTWSQIRHEEAATLAVAQASIQLFRTGMLITVFIVKKDFKILFLFPDNPPSKDKNEGGEKKCY